MRYLLIFFSLLSPLCIFSANRMTTCSFGIGYRGDHIHTEGAPFQVKEHSLHSLLESFRLETLSHNLLLGLALDYGIVLQGKREVQNALPGSVPFTSSFKIDYGYETDVFPKVGYSFALSDTALKCYFQTSVGYGYSRVSLREKDVGNIDSSTTQQLFFDTRSFLYEWFGPFLEAKLDLFQYSVWKFYLAYQYHFLDGKTKQPVFLQQTDLTGGLLAQITNQSATLYTKMSSGSKHVGEIAIFYLPIRWCTIGFESAFSYIKSSKAHQRASIENDIISSSAPATSFQSAYNQSASQTAYNVTALLSVMMWF